MFQSTPLREGRPTNGCRRKRISWFQSTPLREGRRLAVGHGLDGVASFNPRPCARGDLIYELPPRLGSSFNPRPCARGDQAITLTG